MWATHSQRIESNIDSLKEFLNALKCLTNVTHNSTYLKRDKIHTWILKTRPPGLKGSRPAGEPVDKSPTSQLYKTISWTRRIKSERKLVYSVYLNNVFTVQFTANSIQKIIGTASRSRHTPSAVRLAQQQVNYTIWCNETMNS